MDDDRRAAGRRGAAGAEGRDAVGGGCQASKRTLGRVGTDQGGRRGRARWEGGGGERSERVGELSLVVPRRRRAVREGGFQRVAPAVPRLDRPSRERTRARVKDTVSDRQAALAFETGAGGSVRARGRRRRPFPAQQDAIDREAPARRAQTRSTPRTATDRRVVRPSQQQQPTQTEPGRGCSELSATNGCWRGRSCRRPTRGMSCSSSSSRP